MKLPVLTNSSMRTFQRCAREYFVSYVLGYRTVTQEEALRFGSLLHLGLEAWWLWLRAEQLAEQAGPSAAPHAKHGSPLEAAIEAMRGKAFDDFELVRAGVLMQGYDARWRDEPLEALAVESEFRAPLVNPETGAASRTFELAGKLDVIVRDLRDGLVKLIEHKSSSDDIGHGSDYWRMLALDPQVSTYFEGGKASGFEIAECIYDVIGKPGLRPYKATPEESRKYTKAGALYANQRAEDETAEEFRIRLTEHVAENPARYYVRGKVVRLESEKADAAHDAWSTARNIREAELANRWPRNAGSCRRYGRMCSFFDYCTGAASLEDESRFRRVDNPHEELSFEAA